jgi:crotonobetainyl-CoA:carnitine CoA-transferase CaiB-like acyl-CoA transferase
LVPSEEALEGLRVLECGGTTAASYAAKLLSDLGASVVKLEDPRGDPTRRQGPFFGTAADDALSSRFVYLNTGKRSVRVEESLVDQLAALCAEADVLITDETTSADVPVDLPARLVWCAVSPFGLVGPYAGYRGTHLTNFHAGGEGHLLPSGLGWELFPERPPLQIGSDMGDYDAGATAAVAILAACIRQRRSGAGERIDVSAQEAQLTLNRTRLSRYSYDRIELRRGPSQYGIGGMIRCRSGYIQLVGLRSEHWDRLTSGPEGEALRAPGDGCEGDTAEDARRGRALREWCAARDKDDVTRILAAAGCPVGAYAAAADLVASAQLAHRGFFQQVDQPGVGAVTLPGVPYRLSRTPVRLRAAPTLGEDDGFPPRPSQVAPTDTSLSGPLEGIRVLDFTWAAAGPYATLLLAFLGAEVIKVESSRRLDPARRGFMQDYGGVNRSPNFDELNLNKRSFVVDLTQPAGLELVKRLVAVSDVVVDNFRPGVMARYGLDAETLLARHPGLIVASSSANGATGPEAAGAGLASVFGATGGLGEQTGYRDGPPTEVGESTDYRSANALAIALLAALSHRLRTGAGQAIDLASREVVVSTAPDALLAHLAGVDWTPRIGNDHRDMSPHGLYPCSEVDDWIAVAVRDERDWKELCQVLDEPAWCNAFPTAADRFRGREAIDHVIVAWTKQRTSREAFQLLQARGIPACPSFTNKDLAADPHLAARAAFVEVDHPEVGRHRVMRAPWILSDADCSIRQAGPLLGQDNAYVLESILGIPAAEHAQLVEVFR